MILSSRDFLRAARRRLETAEFLVEQGYHLDAMYLAGYGVECSLKALILHLSADEDDVVIYAKISSGARMHYAEALGAILKDQGRPIPLDLIKRYQRYGWRTDLRYATGNRPRGEARGFLKVARSFSLWVEGGLR